MKIYLIILSFLISFSSKGQKQANIWYFGNHAGLDFNSGSPVALTDGQTFSPDDHSAVIEGTATISDSSGSLLFYTNGTKIWNKAHQVMPNGDSLLGNFSSTQAGLIIPQPGSSRYFYVFTTSDFYYQDLQYGFRYSIVDICLDDGRGDVIPDKKNILILDTVAEKLTAVRHANGVDYWIIVHKFFSQDFYAFHLSSAGIIETVISTVGSRHPLPTNPNPNLTGCALGYLKASPNGQKLCAVNANGYCLAEYFDFDKGTGVVSNFVNIQTNQSNNYYGVSFSPDNSKLYIASNLNAYNIYQYDLNAGGGDPVAVQASRTPIAIQGKNYFSLQLATDGKIYVTQGNPTGYVSVIDQPNNSGTACNYIENAVSLQGKFASFGLPNFVDNFDYSNTVYDCAVTPPPPPPVIVVDSSCNLVAATKVYANPFSHALIIDKIPTICKVSMNVYNMIGQLVIKNTMISDGHNEIQLYNLAFGIYYYQFIAGNRTVLTGRFFKQ